MKQSDKVFDINSEFLYQSFAESTSDYVFLWNTKKKVIRCSFSMIEAFGFSSDDLITQDEWLTKIHERDRDRVSFYIRQFLESTNTKLQIEFQMLMANGSYVWMNSKGQLMRDNENDMGAIFVGILHNIEDDGKIDNVTGLFGYDTCCSVLNQMLANELHCRGSLLMIGIDNFTSVNTLNNHSFGDRVLRNTVQDILKLLPDKMSMYRLDGDQFVIKGENESSKKMMQIYEKINQYTTKQHELDGQSYRFTISGGIVSYPLHGQTWPDLEKGVSVALKKAKENGKNRCILFSRTMLEEKMYQQTLTRYLAESVANQFVGFRAVFQPVCEAATLSIKGAEILLRFDTPEGITVSPLEFIPLLENTHLIIPVGIWVLEQAIIVCKSWLRYVPDFVMNVNVSYLQLRDTNFCERVEHLLRKHDLDTRHLTLELTESYFITDAKNIDISLTKLQELHLQLAMDDFGTGYSSLARLSQFNVDVIKIDKMFVQSLHKSKYNHDFVDSVVKLCHNIGMKVCVEGVETREEQRSINSLNVDYIQGFYISKPISQELFYDRYIVNHFDLKRLMVPVDNQTRQTLLVNDRDLLQALMEATPLCLNLWNRNYEILTCNEEVLNLFEMDSTDDFRLHFFEYSPLKQPDGQSSEEKAKQKIDEAFLNGKTIFNWIHCKKNGELIPTEVTFVRIPYREDYVVVSYTMDIRHQIAMEERERRFHQRMLAILDATPLCLNLWNKNFENIMCNKEALNLFDLESEAEYTESFFELSPTKQPNGSESLELSKEMIIQAFQTGKKQFEWMHQNRKKEPIPAEITLVKIDGLGDDGEDLVAGFTRDLRPQLLAERIERLSTLRIRAVIDATPLICILWSKDFKIIDCNQLAVDTFKANNKKEFVRDFDLFIPHYQPDGSVSDEKKLKKFQEVLVHNNISFEWVYQDLNKEEIPCEVTLVCLRLQDEEIIVAYSRDLRLLQKTLTINSRLTQLAYYDILTGSASRVKFIETLTSEFNDLVKNDLFALLIFDIDYFKGVNDTFGHDAGDRTLKQITSKVSSLLPEKALLGRYGGDEFLIMIKGQTRFVVKELIENLVKESAKVEINQGLDTFHVTLSIGGTFWESTDQKYEVLIKRADEALYEAKHRGRNQGVLV